MYTARVGHALAQAGSLSRFVLRTVSGRLAAVVVVSAMADAAEPEVEAGGAAEPPPAKAKGRPARRAKRPNAKRRNSVSSESRGADTGKDLVLAEHPKEPAEMDSIVKVLSSCFLFAGGDETLLQSTALAMFKTAFKAEDTIIQQGDEGDNFYVVAAGVGKVSGLPGAASHSPSARIPPPACSPCVSVPFRR